MGVHEPGVCWHCGDPSGTRRYCSQACVDKARREREREAAELGKAVRVVTGAGLTVSAPESVPVHGTQGGTW